MEDRELLEAAAKAAGHKVYAARQAERDAAGSGGVGLWLASGHTCWNPLTDDGDALRLAVDLQMDVFVRGEWSEAVAPMGAPRQVLVSATTSKREATRRAVVLAAAAMANAQAA